MKILFLNTNIGYGGASKMMCWLANNLSENGFNVSFATYRDKQPDAYELSPRISRKRLNSEVDGHSFQELLHTVRELRLFIKEEKFDLVIAFLSPSQLRLSLATIGIRTKLLFSQRGDPYQSKYHAKSIGAFVESFIWKRANYYVFQTKAAQDYYPNSIRIRSTVIPNPVKEIKRTSHRIADNRIVSVARFDLFQKRQDILIEAFKIIASKFPEVSLHLYGDGEDEQTIRELAGENERIVFEGVTPDIVQSIQNARVFVLSSDFEGIPNALIEAMSLGVPCVSTDCSPGGAALLIKNDFNGLLVPCGDVDQLASGLSRFLSDQSHAEECGHNAKNICVEFSEDKIFHQWKEFIALAQ